MPAVKRGQIVLVEFPFTDGQQAKIRPAVVVQSDAQNAALRKTIVAMITGNLRRRSDPSHVLIDPSADPVLGIHGPSLISCINLFTVDQTSVLRVLGSLTDELEIQLDAALRHSLSL